MARPILDEVLGFRSDFVEHQLGWGSPRDGFGVRGLDRRGQLIRVRGSGTELAVERLVDEGTQPGAEVEAAYVRSELFARPRFLMDDWARYLA